MEIIKNIYIRNQAKEWIKKKIKLFDVTGHKVGTIQSQVDQTLRLSGKKSRVSKFPKFVKSAKKNLDIINLI